MPLAPQLAVWTSILPFLAGPFAVTVSANPSVIAISGGVDPMSNEGDFYSDLRTLDQLLPASKWDREFLVADGPGSAPNTPLLAADGSTIRDGQGRPLLSREDAPGSGRVRAARLESLERAFAGRIALLAPGEPLVVYITDHGARERDGESSVLLWGERLTASRLRGLIASVPASNKVVLIHDHCFSGGMLEAIQGSDGRPRPKTCGIAAARKDQIAYYGKTLVSIWKQAPSLEGWDSDGNGEVSIGELNRGLQVTLGLDSNPVSSSDLYLEGYWEKHGEPGKSHPVPLQGCSVEPVDLDTLSRAAGSASRYVLNGESEALRDTLAESFQAAELPTHSTLERIRAEARSRLANVESEEALKAGLRAQATEAFKDWMISENGGLYRAYIASKERLARLRASGGKAGNAKRIREEEKRHDKLQLETHLLRAAVMKGLNPSFNAWIRIHGGPVPGPYPSTVIPDLLAATERYALAITGSRAIRHLESAVIRAHALDLMIARGDSRSMLELVDMLDCERQSFDPRPKVIE